MSTLSIIGLFIIMNIGLGLAFAIYHRKDMGFSHALMVAIGHGGVILFTCAVGLFLGCFDGEITVVWAAILAIITICVMTIVGGIYGAHIPDVRAAIIPCMCWLWVWCLPAAILFVILGVAWLVVGIFFPAFSFGHLSRWAYQGN